MSTEKMREEFKKHRSSVAAHLIQGEDWAGAYRRADDLVSLASFTAGWKASQAAADAEITRLQRFETAYKEFSDKTDWVRPNAAAHELGMHVADILRKRCDDLTAHNQAQADEIVRLRKDAERVDRLDMECEAYGTDVHEGNRWVADGPFATVRDAIDAAMAQEQQP